MFGKKEVSEPRKKRTCITTGRRIPNADKLVPGGECSFGHRLESVGRGKLLPIGVRARRVKATTLVMIS